MFKIHVWHIWWPETGRVHNYRESNDDFHTSFDGSCVSCPPLMWLEMSSNWAALVDHLCTSDKRWMQSKHEAVTEDNNWSLLTYYFILSLLFITVSYNDCMNCNDTTLADTQVCSTPLVVPLPLPHSSSSSSLSGLSLSVLQQCQKPTFDFFVYLSYLIFHLMSFWLMCELG